MKLPTNIQELLTQKRVQKVHFIDGEQLFIEGDEYRGLYYLIKGDVKVVRNGKNKVAMWFANPLQLVGLSSFFNNDGYYTFSASAFDGDVEALFIPIKDFDRLINDNPVFKHEVIQILCKRILKIRNKVDEVKSQSIKQRFITVLLLLSHNEGTKNSLVSIAYSLAELSELTATSKQYIKKLIIEFQTQEILKIDADKLIIDSRKLHLLNS